MLGTPTTSGDTKLSGLEVYIGKNYSSVIALACRRQWQVKGNPLPIYKYITLSIPPWSTSSLLTHSLTYSLTLPPPVFYSILITSQLTPESIPITSKMQFTISTSLVTLALAALVAAAPAAGAAPSGEVDWKVKYGWDGKVTPIEEIGEVVGVSCPSSSSGYLTS